MSGFTEEQKKQLMNAGSREEKIEIMKKIKMELPDEDLEKVSGGAANYSDYGDEYDQYEWFCGTCCWDPRPESKYCWFVAYGSRSNPPKCPYCGGEGSLEAFW